MVTWIRTRKDRLAGYERELWENTRTFSMIEYYPNRYMELTNKNLQTFTIIQKDYRQKYPNIPCNLVVDKVDRKLLNKIKKKYPYGFPKIIYTTWKVV